MNTLTKAVPLALELMAVCCFGHTSAPARDVDPALVGTVWKGKLTQTGEYKGGRGPLEFDCAFTVTKREGERFEAELYEKTPDLELTYIVRGAVKLVNKSYRIEWESVDSKDVKNTEPITRILYTGTLKGKTLAGRWKYPTNEDGTTLAGEFEFELTKKQ